MLWTNCVREQAIYDPNWASSFVQQVPDTATAIPPRSGAFKQVWPAYRRFDLERARIGGPLPYQDRMSLVPDDSVVPLGLDGPSFRMEP